MTKGPLMSSQVFDELLNAHLTRYYKDMLGLEDYRSRIEARRYEVQRQARVLRAVARTAGIDLAGRRFLDFGCGWGGTVVAAAQAGMEAYGCDIDPEALQISRLRAELAGVHVEIGSSARGIPYSDGSFDVIFCQSVLEHIAYPGPVVREICRVLKKGGVAYIEAPNYRKLIEPHYKIIFPTKLPKRLARQYLSLIGRPPDFIDTLEYVDDRILLELFSRVEGVVVEPVGDRLASATATDKGSLPVIPRVEERLSVGFRLMRRLFAFMDYFYERVLKIKNVHLLVRK